MTNREFLLKSEDPDFAGYLQIKEKELLEEQVICGFIRECPDPVNCIRCQRDWLNAEHIENV